MGQNQNLFENQRDWRREIWRVKKISNGKQSMSKSISLISSKVHKRGPNVVCMIIMKREDGD
jgi:hypothetical protein